MTTYLIHGFLESPSMWEGYLSFFNNPRLLTIPGHGNLVDQQCPSNMQGIAESLLNDINTSEPHQIIGHSMGGYLIPFLVQLGAQPKRIGIFHSKLGADEDSKKIQRLRAIELVQGNKSLYVRTMITHLFTDKFKVKGYQTIEELIRQANMISESNIIACQRAMMERPCGIEIVKSKQIPTHFFAGGKDEGIPLALVQSEALKLEPNSTIRSEDEIGHMGQWEAPQAVLEWLNDHFLD